MAKTSAKISSPGDVGTNGESSGESGSKSSSSSSISLSSDTPLLFVSVARSSFVNFGSYSLGCRKL